MRNLHHQEEVKEAWEINVIKYLRWDHGTDKGHQGKTKEIRMKYRLSLIRIYQLQVISCDKYLYI